MKCSVQNMRTNHVENGQDWYNQLVTESYIWSRTWVLRNSVFCHLTILFHQVVASLILVCLCRVVRWWTWRVKLCTVCSIIILYHNPVDAVFCTITNYSSVKGAHFQSGVPPSVDDTMVLETISPGLWAILFNWFTIHFFGSGFPGCEVCWTFLDVSYS